MPLLDVISENADLLVVNKPAGLVCHPTKAGPLSSLISRARIYLENRAAPQLVHRLDRETGGVLALALTDEAALALRDLWQAGYVAKEYWAIVHGEYPAADRWIDCPLGKDESSPVAIRDWIKPAGQGSDALTHVRLWHVFVREGRPYSLLRVWLHTGRKHQIRIHLASAGFPIVGDKLYGLDQHHYLAFVERRLTDAAKADLQLPNHALHSAKLWVPWRGEEREYAAGPPADFNAFLKGERIEWGEDDETGGKW